MDYSHNDSVIISYTIIHHGICNNNVMYTSNNSKSYVYKKLTEEYLYGTK